MNIESLRRDLLNRFGKTGAAKGNYTAALMNVFKIKNASQEELIQMAKKAGMNLGCYE